MIRVEIIYVDENHAYVNNSCVIPSKNNQLYKEGFLYSVEGDYKLTHYLDKDGYPIYESNVHFFKRMEDAKKYVAEQSKSNKLKEVVVKKVEYKEPLEEFIKKKNRQAMEKRSKKDTRDGKKAKELGITLEEYREIQDLRKTVRKLDSDTNKHENAIKNNNHQKSIALQRLNQLLAKCQSPVNNGNKANKSEKSDR